MRIGIISSTVDPASNGMAEHIIKEHDFEEKESGGSAFYESEGIFLYSVGTELWRYDQADRLELDLIFFLSRHSSANEVPALTVHSLGNWNGENKVGGVPRHLSPVAPLPMLSGFRQLNKIGMGIQKVYEATHHGPLLKTRSFFMEMGGTENVVADKRLAAQAGEAAYEAVLESRSGEIDCSKVAIGVGSGHYPGKFSRMAIEKDYAFSYIMPKYAVYNEDGSDNIDMLSQAVEKSDREPDVAVIDWKGLNAATRAKVIAALDDLGLDYEKA